MTQTNSAIPTTTLSSNYWQNSTFFTAIGIVIAIMVVASISLVYFRRRKGSWQVSQTKLNAYFVITQIS
jgi:LPXTG-motif cell wall-anchored protein